MQLLFEQGAVTVEDYMAMRARPLPGGRPISGSIASASASHSTAMPITTR